MSATRPCDINQNGEIDNADPAYCFDFKTGGADNICTLVGAGIQPEEHTTTLLGIVQDSRYKYVTSLNQIFTVDALFPLKYRVWGDAGACRMIDVDDKPWAWGPTLVAVPQTPATAAKFVQDTDGDGTPNKPLNSQGIATAYQHNMPAGTDIFAKIYEQVGSDTQVSNVLRDSFGIINVPYTMDSIDNTKITQNTKFLYNLPIVVQTSFSLNDIEPTVDNGFKEGSLILQKLRTIWGDPDGFRMEVREIRLKNNDQKVYRFRVVHGNANNPIVYFEMIMPNYQPGEVIDVTFSLTVDSVDIVITYGDSIIEDKKENIVVPQIFTNIAEYMLGDSESNNILFGDVYKILLQGVSSGQQEIQATSTLNINLGDPKVVDYWPSCIEACINAEIGMQFNQIMATTPAYKNDIEGAVTVRQCSDETCTEFIDTPIGVTVGDNVTETLVRLYPNNHLKPATWYQVTVNGGSINGELIKAVGALDANGNIVELGAPAQTKVWKFRTKNSSEACMVDTVQVSPDPFYAYYIGQRQTYYSVPKGAPDVCNVRGQNLNPWEYGWSWASQDTTIATVSDLAAPGQYNPTCGLNCLPSGSNLTTTTFDNLDGDNDGYAPLCGNGNVDSGEDCDIGVAGEVAGQSCTFNCLRPGNTNATTSTLPIDQQTDTGVGLCGDGSVNNISGEQCDPNDQDLINLGLQSYCTSICLWNGSSQTPTGDENAPICGSGSITTGESCDIALDPVGCSEECLNTGTNLAQQWCDIQPENARPVQCFNAMSACGNGIIEAGEECEVSGPNAISSSYCSGRCLLQDVAGTNYQQCIPGSEGCQDDGTFAGSSVLYSTASICGDGVAGIGEYTPTIDGTENTDFTARSCELNEPGIAANLGGGPVQIVTAEGIPSTSGGGDVKVDSRQTYIDAEAQKFRSSTPSGYTTRDLKTDFQYVEYPVGSGEYNLQCGFDEFDTQDTTTAAYNSCPQNSSNTFGVGADSCCYQRPVRTAQYPAVNAGTGNVLPTNGICRNTYIEVEYQGDMDYSDI